MSGLLANLVGAATAALNLRAQDGPARAPKVEAQDGAFASALSAALTPRQRAEEKAPTKESSAKAPAGEAEGEDEAGSALGAATAAVVASATAPAANAATTAAGNEAAAAAAGASTAGASVAAAAPEGADAAHAAVDTKAAADAGAAVAGPGPAPRNPAAVRSSLEGLNPAFRARLERVIARMEKEHGHDVRIVETVRDQARQEYLFAQGRTRPGPVVTWTKSSNHTHGRAADLIVDGTYDNPIAMVRLARIAREEGLRTLGSRDPGHVELPAGARVERLAVGAGSSTLLDGSAVRGAEAARAATAAAGVEIAARPAHSGLAQVAQVATVATVASVAQVARVATPGSIAGGGQEAPAIAVEQAPAAIPGQLAGSGGSSSSDGGRREGRSSNREPVLEALGDASPRVVTGNPFGLESRSASALAAEIRAAPGGFGAEAAERIARVLQLQDAAPARPLSQMVLRLDNAAGGEDRIRVDVRGSSVGAALNVGDPVTAARMHAELGQLQRALEGRGLHAEHLSVTGLAGRELAEALRTTLPTDSGQRGSQDSGAHRDGTNGRPGGGQRDADPEQPRQRPRRNSQQERNT